jgi:hypothetical protein
LLSTELEEGFARLNALIDKGLLMADS